MWKKLFPVFLFVCIPLAGCAVKTEVSYQRPQFYPVEESMVYDAGLEKVWDTAVKSIGGSFFALDQVQKASRTMTLSFTAATPADFVDCGVLTYTNTGGMGDDETVTIDGAAHEARYIYADGASQPREVVRTTTLEGKADLVFSAEGKGKTRVTVKTRYTVGVVNKGYMPVVDGYSEGVMPFATNSSVVFSGGQTGLMHGGGLTQCVSTSALERKVLEDIRAALGAL